MRRLHWQMGAISILLLFWWTALHHLSHFPLIHNDETPLVAAGYKLFQHGIYGLDMHTGLDGHETIYLEVMPLMPWLQGMGSWLWGIGIWQMRMIPVFSGLLTMALLFQTASLFVNRFTGLLALLLMLFWQWGTGGTAFFGSGIALLDLSRIARYDILMAPLSLAVLWVWVVASRRRKPLYFFLCGGLIGLAGLANLYGLFWLAVIGIYWLLLLAEKRTRQTLFAILWVFGGCVSIMSVWGLLVVTHWAEFQGQFATFHQQRFALFDFAFYRNNIVSEGHRYFLGIQQPETWTRIGFWLVVLGLPLSILWLGWRFVQKRERQAVWLLIPSILFPILLALLVQKKTFAYLLLVIPIWVVILSWAISRLWQSPRKRWQVAGVVLMLFVVVEGMSAIKQLQTMSGSLESPTLFFTELQAVVPKNGRFLGPQTYWPAFADSDYRSFVLPFLLSQPNRAETLSFSDALTQIDPDVILVDAAVRDWLITGAQETAFLAYLADHDARLTAELTAYDGTVVQIYELR